MSPVFAKVTAAEPSKCLASSIIENLCAKLEFSEDVAAIACNYARWKDL